MIEAKNVVKSFDGFRALDGLTMTVPHGSIYGLVGPNGAGKSTLLRHVTGVYRQDSGSVLIEGNPVYENPAAKSRIASIPDELYYFLSASTRDMMRFYRGFYPRFDVKRYEALKDVFTTIPEKQPIRRLSKGMQKQSAFWLALCCRPDILVLDEPVDGLDPVMRRQVWSLLMGDVADHGTTVLVSSHNLRELEDVCDHVGILSRGKVLIELKDVFTTIPEKQPIRRLSKGMQKQSAFWLALCCRPDILVLDEPVDGLDPVMRRQVWSLLMGDVADHGTTVLVSSHNLRELEDVCDHVGILSRGKVLIERSLSALQENVVKMQVVFQEKELPQLPGDLQVLHVSQVGRIHTLIIRGNATEITNRLAAFAPILMEALPLTLEEIFIYELGGEDYAVRDIVL